MAKRIDQETQTLKDCVLRFLLGKRIGKGAYRRVYRVAHDEDVVLKLEYCDNEFCNVIEWKVWNAVKDTPLEEWFAPCMDIDLMGVALIQKKTVPFESDRQFKDHVEKFHNGKLPSFFDDVHYGNFGIRHGRLVCHDYGFNHFLDEAVKMEWKNLVHPDVSSSSKAPQETQLELSF